jgi:tetratricopeptide (TPR) repeat protein
MRRFWLAVLLIAAVVAGGLAVQRGRTEAEYRRLLEAGDEALAQGRTYAAIEAFSVALAFRPGSMVAHLRRGQAYQQQESYDAAIRDLTEAARIDPNAPQPLERLGEVYAERGDFARAAEWYSQASKRDERSAALAYRAGYGLYRAGQVAYAVQPLRRAVDQAPDAAQMHHALGLALRDSGDPAGARASLEKAVALAPALIAAREALSDLAGREGHAAEQLRHLEALAAIDPTVSRHLAVAMAAARAGRTDRAVLALGSANDLSPGEPRLHLALGYVWLLDAERKSDRASLRKASEALRHAATGDQSSESLAILGRLAHLQGQRGEALRLLERAVRERPIWPEALKYQMEVLRDMGRTAAADEAAEAYSALTGRGR